MSLDLPKDYPISWEVTIQEQWVQWKIYDILKIKNINIPYSLISNYSSWVICLENLIRENFLNEKNIKILEIWPISESTSESLKNSHIAPIYVLSHRNPDLKCFAIWPQVNSKEEKPLGNVEYMEWRLSSMDPEMSDFIFKKIIWWYPNIIYAQHVFERNLPYTDSYSKPQNIFEESARILSPDGFIVVDNYSNEEIPINKDMPNSRNMIPYCIYKTNNKDGGIYVFKKKV